LIAAGRNQLRAIVFGVEASDHSAYYAATIFCRWEGCACGQRQSSDVFATRFPQQIRQLGDVGGDAASVHGVVDEQDYNSGTQNDQPICNLNASYRCFAAKPFHGFPPD
jgi:hypothetical protein